MGLFIGIYMLCGIFFSIEAKLLGDSGDDCNIDWVYKLLLLIGVLLTGVGLVKNINLFIFGVVSYSIAGLLKFYINKKYKGLS